MKSLYSKSFLNFIRVVSVCFIAVLIYLTGHAVYDVFFAHEYRCIPGLIAGPLSVVVLFFVVFNPQRLGLFVLPLLFYSVVNAITLSNPVFPIIFIELAAVLLWIRGFFNTKRKLKITALVLVYLIPLNSVIAYDFFTQKGIFKNVGLVNYILDIVQIILITFCIIFILIEYLKIQTPQDKVLNIAEFGETTERDAKWLELVQKGIKYEAIAIDYELTLGTVQNRLNKIYHILETGDRIGFLSIYSNAKIIYKK